MSFETYAYLWEESSEKLQKNHISPSEHVENVRDEYYGRELILDIHDVDKGFFNTKTIKRFAKNLAEDIGMKLGPQYSWGQDKFEGLDYDNPKADGISVCQFIYTSSVTIHALDMLRKVFVNVFSCKDFDAKKAEQFVINNVPGKIVRVRDIERV